jgi:DNA sulfur modification protein DndC
MEPLLDFRDWLAETIDPAKKREYRDIKGRDGKVKQKKDGTLAARTYTLETSKLALRKLLEAQRSIQKYGPDSSATLIDEDELHEIRRLWRTERQDWEDCVPILYREINGCDLDWRTDDNGHFDSEQKSLLSQLCEQSELPFDLLARLLEAERRSDGMARRAGIQKAISSVLAEEWRPEEEILTEMQAV